MANNNTRYMISPIVRCSIGRQILVFEYELIPNNGNDANNITINHPAIFTFTAKLSFSRRFNCIAYVMANKRSNVITVNVKMDNNCANTVIKPAILQPIPIYRPNRQQKW